MRAAVLLGLVCLGACGGAAAPGAKSPETSGDVDALAGEIEAAERDLSAELGPEPGAQPKPTEPAAGGEGMAEEKKPEPAATTPSPEASPPRSPCETACKALGSMKRSQERICEIAGAAHERCEWAKQRVAAATARIEKAGCSCS